MKRLFFSQSMLDSMVDAGKIRVEGNRMTMLAGDHPVFLLFPAYRLVRTIDNAPDPAGLVSQIRAERELKAMGAEVYMDSVIYRDIAYQADPGFIAEKEDPAEAAAEKAATPEPERPAEAPADQAKSADDLSRFILDKLL